MREHSDRGLSYAYHRGATWAEAEDVVAEVFLVCWRRLDDVPASPVPWLVGVARKVLANHWRSRRRWEALQARIGQEIEPCDDGWGSLVSANDSNPGVSDALSLLSDADREILILFAWDGLSYEEAAEVLGCTKTAIGLRLHRARSRYMKHFAKVRTHSAIEDPKDKNGRRDVP